MWVGDPWNSSQLDDSTSVSLIAQSTLEYLNRQQPKMAKWKLLNRRTSPAVYFLAVKVGRSFHLNYFPPMSVLSPQGPLVHLAITR